MLEIKNLSLTYTAATTAVESFSASVEAGERLAVLGGSGAGKTSLLKCLAGLYPATAGSVVLDGVDITLAKPRERGVQMIFEDLGLAPWQRLVGNMKSVLRLQGVTGKEATARLERLFAEFRLTPVAWDRARTLSDTDAVRAGFLRTKLRDAKIVLIDNPFKKCAGLRAEMFEDMLPHMETVTVRGGTCIFATDSVEEAFSFSDKIAFMHFGVLEQLGTRTELKDSPASLVVDVTVNPERSVMDRGGEIVTALYEETEDGGVYNVVGTRYVEGRLFALSHGGIAVRLKDFTVGKTVRARQVGEIRRYNKIDEKRILEE